MVDAEKYKLQSVDNALQILNVFEQNEKLTVQEIAHAVGISKSAAFRLVVTLENQGFLMSVSESRYSLGMRVLLLGHLAHERIEIMRYTHNYLSELGKSLGERVQLDIWYKTYMIVLVDRSLTHSRSFLDIPFGQVRFPHMTSGGIALLSSKPDAFFHDYIAYISNDPSDAFTQISYDQLLAEVNDVREKGYATNPRQFRDDSLTCIGLPVLGMNDKAIAAISVTGPASRIKANHNMILTAMRETSAMISTLNLNI